MIFLVQPYLPRSILWRQKEQFSDGVGYSWIDGYVFSLSSRPQYPSFHFHLSYPIFLPPTATFYRDITNRPSIVTLSLPFTICDTNFGLTD